MIDIKCEVLGNYRFFTELIFGKSILQRRYVGFSVKFPLIFPLAGAIQAGAGILKAVDQLYSHMLNTVFKLILNTICI